MKVMKRTYLRGVLFDTMDNLTVNFNNAKALLNKRKREE